MTPQMLVVTGTGTDVGKTITVAALATAAKSSGLRVAVCKVAQTGVGPGEPGDLATVTALAGAVPTREIARYREPLAPETAARRAGRSPLRLEQAIAAIGELAAQSDLVIVEGAGGVMVRLAPDLTIIDIIAGLDTAGLAPQTLVVTKAGLGTLNHTELTVDALRSRGCTVAGLVIGSWPRRPDLAMTCNREDLERLTGVPIVATLPARAGTRSAADFQDAAPGWVRAGLLHATA